MWKPHIFYSLYVAVHVNPCTSEQGHAQKGQLPPRDLTNCTLATYWLMHFHPSVQSEIPHMSMIQWETLKNMGCDNSIFKGTAINGSWWMNDACLKKSWLKEMKYTHTVWLKCINMCTLSRTNTHTFRDTPEEDTEINMLQSLHSIATSVQQIFTCTGKIQI